MPWKTTTPTDRERIRKVLQIPAERTHLDLLQASMDRVTIDSPDTIATVQSLLNDWDELRDLKSSEVLSGNGGLIRKKVDVLEYEWQGGRTGGLDSRSMEIADEIAIALHVEKLSSRGSPGYLARS